MTTDTDMRPDDDIEQRLARAMQSLAQVAVSDQPDPPAAERRLASRLVTMAAATILLVAGVIAIAVMQRDDPTIDRPPGAATNPTSPSAESATSPEDPVATNPDGSALEGAPATSAEPRPVVAVLESAVGEGPATTPGRVDRWINEQVSPHRAVRTNADGSIDAVSWDVALASEWTKTFHDQAEVALGNGTTARRMVPTAVDVIVYAVQTDDGVFAANFPPALESWLAVWFAEATSTPIEAVDSPDGFTTLPSESDHSSVNYATGVSTYTVTFDAPIDLDSYLAATARGATVEPLGEPGTVLVTLPGPPDARHAYVVWQPQADTIVQLTGPHERLALLAPHLELATMPVADVTERNTMTEAIDVDTADVVLLGETSHGRFAYLHDIGADGRSCTAFHHSAFGGGGSCADQPAPTNPPACGSGWNAPDLAVAHAFVIGATPPTFEFTISGATVQPLIETGMTDDIPWTYATVREQGHNEAEVVRITVNQIPC